MRITSVACATTGAALLVLLAFVSAIRTSADSSQPASFKQADKAGLKTCGPPVTHSVFVADGWGAYWSHALNTIAFNRQSSDGYFHIFLINPDGSNERVFGASTPGFPAKTVGTPAYSPNGKYLAFAAEKAVHPEGTAAASPGWGGYSDLWVARSDGSKVWQMTNTPSDPDHGTMLPEFSPDGTLLEWTERTKTGNPFDLNRPGGDWAIKVADFVDQADGPALQNIRSYSPGGDHFNETGGFSPDSKSLVFTSDFANSNFWKNQIFRLDLATGKTTQLTDGDEYNEHPRYTPDGRVIWMSGKNQCLIGCGSDWWIMNADGSNQVRLTYFDDKTSPGYYGREVWATEVQTANWSPDGSYFYGDVLTNLITNRGQIVKVSLTCS